MIGSVQKSSINSQFWLERVKLRVCCTRVY